MTENSYPNNLSQNCIPEDDHPRVLSISHADSVTDPAAETVGFGIRALAAVIDRLVLSTIVIVFFIIGCIAIRITAYLQSGVSSLPHYNTSVLILTYFVIVLLEIAYYSYFHACTGQTVGKMFCGIKVVDNRGELISYRRAFCRWIGYMLSALPFYLGLFWVALDRAHQGWHDKIAETYVVKM